MNKEEYVAAEIERLVRRWASRASFIGAAVFLLLAPLDLASVPQLFPRFFGYRVAAAAALLVLGALARRAARPAAIRLLLFLAVLCSAAIIELMVLDSGGHRSPYYAGMTLLGVLAMGLLPLGPRFLALLALTIHAAYLLPILALERVVDARLFATQNCFLFFLLWATVLIRVMNRASLVRQLGLSHDLAAHESRLEEEVAQRTAQLESTLQEWRATLDSTSDLVLLVDEDDVVVKANLAAAEFAGRAVTAMPGTPLTEFLPAADLPCVQVPLAQMRRTWGRVREECFIPRLGRWFLLSAEPFRGPQSWPGGAVLTLRDITETKNMEEALVQARDDWEETFDVIQEGISIHGARYQVLRANAAVRRLLGAADAAAVGRSCHDLFHTRPGPVAGCPGCEADRLARPVSVNLFDAGTGRHLEVTAMPRPGGKDPGVIHVVRDVTERMQAYAEVARGADRLQRILEHAPFGIFIVDPDGRVEFANPAILAFSGFPREQFVGSPLADLPGCAELGMKDLVGAALEGTPFRFGPTEYRCSVRERGLWARFAGVPFEEGGRRKVLVFVEDVTSLRKAEEDRHRLNRLLLQAQKMESIGTLASGIAHDFNNILLATIGFSDAAAEKLPPGHPAHDDLAAVVTAGERGAGLVRQLLAFGRQQDLQMRPVDLNSLVEETRLLLSRVLPKTVRVEVWLGDLIHPVLADPVQIEQVLMNLAVNARDAMPQGGTLTIATEPVGMADDEMAAQLGLAPGLYSLLRVRDTGAGMSREVLERVFEPFFTTKEEGRGTGLGLSTVYGIVAQHGGTIHVQSAPGEGSVFTVWLPAFDWAEPPAAGHPDPLPRGTETILVVEDDNATRRVLVKTLENLGYRVLEAAGGDEAARVFEEGGDEVALALLDVVLPGVHGREVADRLLERHPGLKVLFVSGHPEEILSQQGLAGRCQPLLSKAQGPGAIARAVRRVLDGEVIE